jgi:hypothetical protein
MKKLLVEAVALLGIGVPVLANTVTLDFSGTVNLSGIGGAASNTFSGSVTWDPTATPTSTGMLFPGTYAQYAPVSASLTLNSVDVSAAFFPAPFLEVDIVPSADELDIVYYFPGLPVSDFSSPDNYTNLKTLVLNIIGPPDMFSSTALPGSLDFLGSVSLSESRWFTSYEEDPDVITTGSLAVPEPGTLTLTALGLAGVLAGYRRRHRRSPR